MRVTVLLGLGLLTPFAYTQKDDGFSIDATGVGEAIVKPKETGASIGASDDEEEGTTTITLRKTSTLMTTVKAPAPTPPTTSFPSLGASSNPKPGGDVDIPKSCTACEYEVSEDVTWWTWTTDKKFADFLHTATFTYTALTIIDKEADTTSYTVIVPEEVLEAGFTPPTETNERGTRTVVSSYSHQHQIITTTVAFPTAVMDFPDQITINGAINTVFPNGTRTCPDGKAIIEVDRNPEPAKNCEHGEDGDCLEIDPLGWLFGLGSDTHEVGPFVGRLPLNETAKNMAVCNIRTVLPAVVPFQSSWLLVGKGSTSFVEKKADATPKPAPAEPTKDVPALPVVTADPVAPPPANSKPPSNNSPPSNKSPPPSNNNNNNPSPANPPQGGSPPPSNKPPPSNNSPGGGKSSGGGNSSGGSNGGGNGGGSDSSRGGGSPGNSPGQSGGGGGGGGNESESDSGNGGGGGRGGSTNPGTDDDSRGSGDGGDSTLVTDPNAPKPTRPQTGDLPGSTFASSNDALGRSARVTYGVFLGTGLAALLSMHI